MTQIEITKKTDEIGEDDGESISLFVGKLSVALENERTHPKKNACTRAKIAGGTRPRVKYTGEFNARTISIVMYTVLLAVQSIMASM